MTECGQSPAYGDKTMFCQECGNKLILKFCENEGLVPYCETCGTFRFPPFKTAVSMCVVNRALDKILLAKHTNGETLLLAGYVKKGESAEKTIAREIREETGLNVIKTKYVASRYHEPRNVLMLNFIVSVTDGETRLNPEEITEAAWYSFDEALGAVTSDSTAAYFLNADVTELKKGRF